MLALIAGEGALPALLYSRLSAVGEPPIIAELKGYPSRIQGVETIEFRVEHLGSFLSDLKLLGVKELCLAGKVGRPILDPTAVDALTEPYVPGIVHAIQSGDDGALREILAIIEEFGFELRAAHELLPELLPATGILTTKQPNERDQLDANRAASIVVAMGAADVGQSCVVAAGQALAIESIGGTDWMLKSLSNEQRPTDAASGGVLFKAPKPGQDRRADLPVIGPNSIENAKAAGLDGIVIEAGGVMVLEIEQTVKLANAANLFIWVREN